MIIQDLGIRIGDTGVGVGTRDAVYNLGLDSRKIRFCTARFSSRRRRMRIVPGAIEMNRAFGAVVGPLISGDIPLMAEGGDRLRLRRRAAGAGMLLRSGIGAGRFLRDSPGAPGMAEGGLRRDRGYDGLRAVEDRRALRAGVVSIVAALRTSRGNSGMRDIGMPGCGDRLRLGIAAIGAGAGLRT